MSNFSLETAKIVGASTETSWSQVHTFFPKDRKKLEKRGQLLVSLSLKKTSLGDEDMVAFGRETISRLHEEYFGTLEGGVLARLKEAVSKVSKEITEGIEIEVVAAALVQGVVYLIAFGEGKVVLKRNDSLAVVCQGEKGMVKSSSGYLREGDLVFLGTADFFRSLAEGTLKAALMTDSVQEVVEALAPVVYGQSDLGSAVAVVAKVKKEDESRSRTASSEADTPKLRRKGFKIFRGDSLGRIRPEKSRKKSRRALIIAMVSIFLLVISFILGIRQKRFSSHQEEAKQALSRVRLKLEEARALIGLNPIRARQLLTEAEELVAEVKEEKDTSGEVLGLKQEIEEVFGLALRKYQLEELSLFFDLKIIKEEGRGEKLVFSDDSLMVLDSSNKAVYQVGVENKRGEIIAGGDDLQGAYDLAFSGQKLLILTPAGIVEKDLKSEVQKVVIEADQGWGEIVDFWTYGSNLYLLDRQNLDLYRYPVIEGGFGSKQSWLKGEKNVLARAVSMAINGSIWVLKEDGTILKFTHGFMDPFEVASLPSDSEGLDQSFSSPQLIYTDVSQENLYILERDNQRVVVLGKDGEYRSQYCWSKVERVEEMVVSEEKGKIWLLGGSKIFEIEIKS